MIKYPSTPHLEGSGLQRGDSRKEVVSLDELAGRHLVVEEKFDGANVGVSFGSDGQLALQSRGHFLAGGDWPQFDTFKAWARAHEFALREALGSRYVMYGEWMGVKHTVFYDALPHLFLEFDVYDRASGEFLSTPARRDLLADAPVTSVKVLWEGAPPNRPEALRELVGPSFGKSPRWRDSLRRAAERAGVPVERAEAETDLSDMMEGLYVKVEDGDRAVGRVKHVRPDFVQAIMHSGSHWRTRPAIANATAPGIDIYASPGSPGPGGVGW